MIGFCAPWGILEFALMDRLLCGLFLTLMGTTPAPSHAEDQAWMLEFTCDRPQQVALQLPFEGEEAFWYMTYAVTNRTGADRYLYLKVFLVVNDDSNRTHRDRLIPALEREIEKAMDTEMSNRIELIGRLKNGETRKCVALFGPIGYDIRSLDVYIDGLSDEALVRNEEGKYLLRGRRFHIQFVRIGDPKAGGFPVLSRQRLEKLYIEESISEPKIE
ncbi:MAG: hypothetical protein HYU36_02830 [Planctomycetes bacterium]|nr:hypothetical protein [Planctomycetota bacterium]